MRCPFQIMSHPSALANPPFETLAGLLAAPIDKLKDTFAKFPSGDEVSAAQGRAEAKRVSKSFPLGSEYDRCYAWSADLFILYTPTVMRSFQEYIQK